jgi:hypothetical protein
LHSGDADEIRGSEGALEFEDAGGFLTNGGQVASGAFATGAKNIALGADYQDASGRVGSFSAKHVEHSVKHCAGNAVSFSEIVQREGDDFACSFNLQTRRSVRAWRI